MSKWPPPFQLPMSAPTSHMSAPPRSLLGEHKIGCLQATTIPRVPGFHVVFQYGINKAVSPFLPWATGALFPNQDYPWTRPNVDGLGRFSFPGEAANNPCGLLHHDPLIISSPNLNPSNLPLVLACPPRKLGPGTTCRYPLARDRISRLRLKDEQGS